MSALCRSNGSEFVTTYNAIFKSQIKVTYICIQMEFIATILGHYTDENRLLWQYFNETQPKWIFNLSQKKATHFRQLKENKWQGKTILSYIYTASFIYLRYIESDIETRHLASIYSVPNNVALYCFESK